MEEDFHKRRTLPGLPPVSEGTESAGEIPKLIGPYKIESLLEKGGMSVLYLGLHPVTQEPTTIKALHPKFLTHPEVVTRFLNESEIIAMTDHPNIVKLYGHGEWEGGLYIAMEYIEGTSLRQTLLQSPLSLKKALEIIIDIAYALCHLHTHGVIHRDLKPENILITEEKEVKVIDFGIAQILTERGMVEKGGTQRVIGTPIYMSPEQREDPESVSYPSDIYSLGIIAYELILGKPSQGQIHISLMPKGIQKILSKALQPRPQDRYRDVVDLITDLSSYMNSTQFFKERKAGDQLSEISENLRHMKSLLLSSSSPNWPGIEVSISSLKGIALFGIYHDFFALQDGCYGVLMGESSAKGAEGVIYAATVKGMVHALIKEATTPADFAQKLNTLIFNELNDQFFALGYLVLNPQSPKLSYISCGEINLWKIGQDARNQYKIDCPNIALGIDKEASFKEVSADWEAGDSLILSSFSADREGEDSDAFFHRVISEKEKTLSIQRFLDSVLRKAKTALPKSLEERSLSLIGLIHRSDS